MRWVLKLSLAVVERRSSLPALPAVSATLSDRIIEGIAVTLATFQGRIPTSPRDMTKV